MVACLPVAAVPILAEPAEGAIERSRVHPGTRSPEISRRVFKLKKGHTPRVEHTTHALEDQRVEAFRINDNVQCRVSLQVRGGAHELIDRNQCYAFRRLHVAWACLGVGTW